MDLLPSIDELREHLLAHDRAIREIMMLDGYIERLCEQTFLSTMGDYLTPAFQKMIRVAVAEGMKRMYKEYRLQKWLKVQEMAATVRRVLTEEVVFNDELEQDQADASDEEPAFPLHQPEVNNWQLAAPQAYNWYPVTDNWQRSPVLNLVSPIITPTTIDSITPNYREHRLQITPGHIATLSTVQHPSNVSPQLINRQLFPDNISVTQNLLPHHDQASSDCEDSGSNLPVQNGSEVSTEVRNEVPRQVFVYNSVDQSGFHNGLQSSQEVRVEHNLYRDNPRFVNQEQYLQEMANQEEMSHYPSVSHPQQLQQQPQQYVIEHLDDEDEQMDWDDDSSFEDSDDSLAGVLFAAQSLLPDEQAIRLDVEMGDMGIGHMLFDRVSATWYTSHCEFYRGD